MANVNSIRCCAFDKAYGALESSRKGCLCDKELYTSALLNYQSDILWNAWCLTNEQSESLFQKLKLKCNCCAEDIELENPDTGKIDYCFHYATFIDNNAFDGWEIDNQDFILNINTVMNTYTGRGETYSEDTTPSGAIITYFGLSDELPNPDIEDTNINVPYFWSAPICDTTCWRYEFLKPDFVMTYMNLGFSPNIVFASTLAIMQNINVNVPADITLLQTFLRNIYGPQVVVSAVTLPSTNIEVTITGVYILPSTTVSGNTTVAGPFTWNNISCP